MYCLSGRHVSSACQSPVNDDGDLDLRFNSCCSTPLVVLGYVQGKNGLGVTQNMNINYHAPVSLCVFSSLVFLPVSYAPLATLGIVRFSIDMYTPHPVISLLVEARPSRSSVILS